MHSPILINYDPGWIDEWSAWEYETDDYYDGDGPEGTEAPREALNGEKLALEGSGTGKRKRTDSASRKRKRRRQDDVVGEEEIPGLDLEEGTSEATIMKLTRPLIIWRNEKEREGVKVPLVKDGEGVKVSLLKDWKERLGITVDRTAHGSPDRPGVHATKMRKNAKTEPLPRTAANGGNVSATSKKRAREKENVDDFYESSASDEESNCEQDRATTRGSKRDAVHGTRTHKKDESRLHEKPSNTMIVTNTRKSKRLKAR